MKTTSIAFVYYTTIPKNMQEFLGNSTEIGIGSDECIFLNEKLRWKGKREMIKVLYEDQEIIVAVKPAGVEAQSAKRFAPDMVSEIKKYLVINKLCTPGKEPYVGVIHRLDKPVSGIMVYARTKNAAARLSSQLQNGEIKKTYMAVVCGKPINVVDNFVDYLKKDVDGNYSQIVDKGITDAKRAELTYRLLDSVYTEDETGNGRGSGTLSLLEINLMTGRHHQIRVQCACHHMPLWGDKKYHPEGAEQGPLALCAAGLEFVHPKTGKLMKFSIKPSGGVFEKFFHCE